MAKKKRGRKAGAAAGRIPRKEPYSAQRMEAILVRIKDQAARISSLARAMQEAGLDTLVIDGHQMLIRGLNQIDNFIDNASRAVREAKVKREF